MNRSTNLRGCAALLLVLTSPIIGRAAAIDLPLSAALPAGSSTQRGFVVRSAQAPADAAVGNSLLRALRQLDRTLTDPDGNPVPNEAVAGGNPDGSFNVSLINFEKDAAPFDLMDADFNLVASFTPDFFSGIPGSGGHTDKFTVEAVAFLELTAGLHTFGVSVGADRTDVNDDDNYTVLVGPNPRDFQSLKVAEYSREGALQAFGSNQHAENLWTVNAPVAGLYPFRFVYWQTGRGANLQWYSLEGDSGERVFINDDNDPRALKAYSDTSVAAAKGPYAAELSPIPDSDGNSPAAPIAALIVDGAATVATTGVKLFLNNTKVTPQSLTKANGQVLVHYDPNATRPDANNVVRLEFKDSTGASHTNLWTFGIAVGTGPSTVVTGQWDFDSGDLRATVGKPLVYLDGVDGLTASETQFGTTTDLGVPDIDGAEAKVMYVPGEKLRELGYIMDHGIKPNGGGTRVNQYTIIFDILVSPGGAASLLQISSPTNAEGDDGDLFWQGNNFGQGDGGYKGTGAFTPNEWHRVVAAYDEAAKPPVVTKFVDGIFQDDWTANQGLDNSRRALLPKAVLFGDGDHDERHEIWVNSIQIRSGRLSKAEIIKLGGPTASGIPLVIPSDEPPTLTISRSGSSVVVSWGAEASEFQLESTSQLINPAWAPVPNVVGTSATIPIAGDALFLRLHLP